MIVYHYSQTIKKGDRLEPGHLNFMDLCEPFMQALSHGRDCFFSMLLNGKYMFAVLNRSNLRYWADYAKWATEALFEYVRKNEYSQCVSRLHCNYFCTDLNECIRMYTEDWGEEDKEEKEKVHLFEVEVPGDSLEMRDISIYDAAYEVIHDRQDVDVALAYARRYFAGEHGDEPNWEYLSAGDATAVSDISHFLREQE